MTAFLYAVIALSVLLIISSIYQTMVIVPRKKALIKHHELSWKLTNLGSETKNLNRAKECLRELSENYESVRNFASANAKSCFEDDIELIRCNAEMLATEKWASKAEQYVSKMIEAHSLIVDHDFRNVEKAYASKAAFLKAYDSYFDWTRQCYEDNRGIWKDINLWDEAKKRIREALEGTESYIFWDNPMKISDSVRRQIDCNLSKHIESMRPEYLRKIRLKDLILQRIAENGSVQRSLLLKSFFDGFTEAEVRACYRGIASEHSVIEVKQGNVYFVSMSDVVARKYPPKQKEKESQLPPAAEQREGESMIAPMTKVLYRELIRHFDEEGIAYVDKTANGGGLYFFCDAEAEKLKEKGYPVNYAEKGTKGTGHRPAWYIKL